MPTLRDLRLAIRALRGAPVVSVLAIACVGLGIGSVTTVYSTATAFTFRPLPQMRDAGELMLVAETPVSDRLQGTTLNRNQVAEVVGVVRDVRANPLTSDSPTSVVYAPLAQWPARTASVVLRTRSDDPTGQTAALQQTIARLDSRLAAGEVFTMARVIETVTSPQSATAQVLMASAFIALLMAVVGTYGVMAYTVERRTREIGVRIALGATTGLVVRDVLGGAARVTAVGVALGLAGAAGLGLSMQAILVDTDPTDPVILGGAAALLGAAALAAGFLPAHRASRVDAVTALRAE